MTAGLPGIGLSGLFFILSSLLMPFIEIVQVFLGRSSLERWRIVARQFVMSLVMIAATGMVALVPTGATDVVRTGARHIPPVVITILLLGLLVVSVETFALLAGSRREQAATRTEPRTGSFEEAA